MKKKIKKTRLYDTEGIKEYQYDTSNRVYVYGTIDHDEEGIIEVQSHNKWGYFSRILYGTSKIITSSMCKKDSYGSFPNVISVSMCCFGVG